MTNGTLLFLVDGMRPDGLLAAHTPTIDRLMATGAWTYDARTVMPSITLPCIVSLFQSRPPERHGVTTNVFEPDGIQPGIFEVIAQAGRHAASFYNWEQLRDLSQPGALHASHFLKNCYEPEGSGDVALTRLAVEQLRRDPVDFAFIYLGYTDVAGHDHGWMSEPYLAGIENADRCIGMAFDGLDGSWDVIVTADHGGHETSHGSDLSEDVRIPIVMHRNPTRPAGPQLTLPVSILDVAPTIIDWLGLEAPAAWEGRVIT